MEAERTTGGCQCGNIRYEITGAPAITAWVGYLGGKRLPWLRFADGPPRRPEFPLQEQALSGRTLARRLAGN